MKYYVYDSRYESDKSVNALYGTNKRYEAIKVADEVSSGAIVIQLTERKEKRIYAAPYKSDLGLAN